MQQILEWREERKEMGGLCRGIKARELGLGLRTEGICRLEIIFRVREYVNSTVHTMHRNLYIYIVYLYSHRLEMGIAVAREVLQEKKSYVQRQT